MHDNAVYIGPDHDVQVVLLTDWSGWARCLEFRNNLFHSEGIARYGHQTSRADNGAFSISPGWGPAQEVVFRGNRYVGRHEDPPEDHEAPATTAPRPIEFNDWPGPQFDPHQPDTFPAYLEAHRAWMLGLMERQFGRLPAELQGPASGAARDVVPPRSRPAWVSELLTNRTARIPYAELTALEPEFEDELIQRYRSLPLHPFTNRVEILRALARVGSERTVELIQQAILKEYQGQRLNEADGRALSGLPILMGHLASRHESALRFLKPGLDEAYWSSNTTWTIEGDGPAGELVPCTIRGLALSGKDEAWNLVIEKRRGGSPEYLDRYAGSMVDAAAWRRTILDHGRAYLATNSSWDLFCRWAATPEGLEWRRWSAQIAGVPEP